jgi:phage FluMu protein Com
MRCTICNKVLPDDEDKLTEMKCELYYGLPKAGRSHLMAVICPECHAERTTPNYSTKKEN